MDTGQCSEKLQASFCQTGAKRGKRQVREQPGEDSLHSFPPGSTPPEHGGILPPSTLSVRLKQESSQGSRASSFP